MARSKRKPSNRAKARTVVTPSESEDLAELTPDPADSADESAVGDKESDSTESDGTESDGTESGSTESGGKASAAASAADPVSKQAPKDPVPRRGGKGSPGDRTPSAAATRSKDPVAEKAKDPAKPRSPKKAASAEAARTGRRAVVATQNPAWLVPAALTLLILGLVYLVAYYLSAGTLPLPIGDWNLAAGFGLMLVGGGMLMFWK